MKKLLLGVLLATSSMLSAQNSNDLYGITDQSIVRIIDTADASSSIDYDSKNQIDFNRTFGLTYVSSESSFYGIEYIEPNNIQLFSYKTCSGANRIAQITYNDIPVKHAEALAYNSTMDSVFISYNEDHDYASDQLGIIDLKTGIINKIGNLLSISINSRVIVHYIGYHVS